MARLKDKFQSEGLKELQKQLGIKNPMRVPRLKCITLSCCLSEALTDKRVLEKAAVDLEKISGQKTITTIARKSIANFKLREGQPLGVKVTLRKNRMYEFYDRLVNAVLPRVRDFRGVSSKSFDGRGNYTLGIKEQIIFPEIDYDQIDKIRGLNITIVTSAQTDAEGKALLGYLGMPFKN